jgi:tetratricopeptide (TPR) repeat protein
MNRFFKMWTMSIERKRLARGRRSFYDISAAQPRRPLHLRRNNFFRGLVFLLLSLFLIASPAYATRIPDVRIIVVNKQSDAENILSEINKGGSFALLAKERSVDEKSRDRYGEIEKGAFESLDKPLKEAALRLREGQVSGVISLGDNRYGLVLVIDMGPYKNGSRAFRSGDFKTAETDLLKHVELNPDAVKARVYLGRIYESANQENKAEENYREALRFDPGHVEAYERLGALYLGTGRFQQAVEIYDEGLRQVPDSRSLKVGRKRAEARLPKAVKEAQKTETAKAGPVMEEPPKVAIPKSEPVNAETEGAKGNLPPAGSGPPKKVNVKAGPVTQEPPTAVEAKTEAPKAGIGSAGGNLSRAVSEAPKKEIARAAPAKDEPQKVNLAKAEVPKLDVPGPGVPRGGASKGEPPVTDIPKSTRKVHLRIIFTAKESDAQDILSQVRKGKPFALLAKERSVDERTKEAYGYLGEVGVDSLDPAIRDAVSQLREGETSGVIRVDQDRYAIVQDTHMSLYREGEKAFIEGDLATARKKLLEYVEENPDAVKACAMLATIYEDKKEPSKAIELYKKAISFAPRTTLLYERLARVYLLLGMYQKAKDIYIEGLKNVPSSPVLEEGIEMADLLLIGDGERTP